MNTEIIHDTCQQSVTNNLPFPEVLKRLREAGVESYYADLVQRQKTYCSASGAAHVSPLKTETLGPVAEEFDASKVQEALRAIREKKIGYVEFLRRIVAAGTLVYTVHIRGRRAIYLGRMGDLHIEHFPPEQ